MLYADFNGLDWISKPASMNDWLVCLIAVSFGSGLGFYPIFLFLLVAVMTLSSLAVKIIGKRKRYEQIRFAYAHQHQY